MSFTIKKEYNNGKSELVEIYGNTMESVFERLGEHIREENVIRAEFLSSQIQDEFINWIRKKSYGDAYNFFND